MTATAPKRPAPPESREARVGLRARIWLACVSGGAVAGLGSLWVLGTRVQPAAVDPADLLAWLTGVALAAVVAGIVFALWLDHHVVGHLRGVLRGIERDRVSDLRGLPGSGGWGELSQVSEVVGDLLGQQRRAQRATTDLEQLRADLAQLQEAVERWARDERWETPETLRGPAAGLTDALARGVARRATVEEQNREAAAQVARELTAALQDAQEAATQAERGFVEATAMLTTVRELQRLTGELQTALDALAAAPSAAAAPAEAPAATREVLEDLVAASHDSVESISRGMLRVHDVAEQVQQMANRATLIAIHVVTGTRRDEPHGDDVAGELKRLARDVRDTHDLAAQYALDVETAVSEASARMRDARERALSRLQAPASADTPAAPAAPSRAQDDVQRLFERVREMVQDAARKGERLSQAGERASRAAERLVRRIDEEAAESEALAVRLTPVPATPAPAPEAAPPVELRLYSAPPAGADDEPAAGAPAEERP